MISLSVFSELGYINQLFSVSDWLPAFKITGQVLNNLSSFLGGLAGPMSTYFAGKYTAGHYGRSTGTAGVTSLLVSLIIGSRELLMSPLNDGDLTRINLPASINIMLAIFVGYLVGQIFRFSRASDDQIVDKDYIYQPKTVRPIFLSLILAVGLNILLFIGEQRNVFQTISQFVSRVTVTHNHLFSTFMMGLLSTFSAWVGNSQAFAHNAITEDSFALENLTYAVSHHTTTGLPHLYTLTNLYHSYGLVAGIGSGLASLGALTLKSTMLRIRRLVFLVFFLVSLIMGPP